MASGQSNTPQKLQRGKPQNYTSCMLYDLKNAHKKLAGLTVAACNPVSEKDVVSVESDSSNTTGDASYTEKLRLTVSDAMSCNFCDTTFDSRLQQKRHYRSDWHRYNLKQRLKGQSFVTEDQFEVLSGNVSSISGSDTESETSESESETSASGQERKPRHKPRGILSSLKGLEYSSTDSESEGREQINMAARRLPKVYFRNAEGELISLYRCVIYHKKNQPSQQSELVSMATDIPNHMNWAIFMAGGGHFAAAIFDSGKIVVHKTFHRYVVRAKRGTAQGSRDSQGNAPKSSGASLRRYNEVALTQEIHELISSWEDYMKSCDKIFLRAPSFNKRIFFSGKSAPFKKDDTRIRLIPFQTRRPTFNEIRRVYEMLASIECYGSEADIQDFIPISPPQVFNPETGQLAIREDSPSSPRHRKQRGRKLISSPLVTDQLSDGEKLQVHHKNTEEDVSVKNDEKLKEEPTKIREKISGLPDHVVDSAPDPASSATSTASDSELVEMMQTINLLEHDEFYSTKKPRRKKKQKKRSSGPISSEQKSDIQEEIKYQMRNSLYTACKVSDTNGLKNLLNKLSASSQDRGDTSDKPTDIAESLQPTSEGQLDVPPNKEHLPQSCVESPVVGREVVLNPTSAVKNPVSSVDIVSLSEGSTVTEHRGDSAADDIRTAVTGSDTDVAKIGEVAGGSVAPVETGSEAPVETGSVAPVETGSVYVTETEETVMAPAQGQTINIPTTSGVIKDSAASTHGSSGISAAILNETFGDNKVTLLHVAAKEGHKEAISLLMLAGASPSLRDKSGLTPYLAAPDKPTRNEFRKFRATYPDMYDYDSAKVPPPLTEEMENERKKKEAEKRKAQKKARQERQKVKKAEEAVQEAEEREKKRFLNLSDREKRALAAEKRLVNQVKVTGAAAPVLSRCFQCGQDITGKVPFQYQDFTFCTPKCLQQHRKQAAKR